MKQCTMITMFGFSGVQVTELQKQSDFSHLTAYSSFENLMNPLTNEQMCCFHLPCFATMSLTFCDRCYNNDNTENTLGACDAINVTRCCTIKSEFRSCVKVKVAVLGSPS